MEFKVLPLELLLKKKKKKTSPCSIDFVDNF